MNFVNVEEVTQSIAFVQGLRNFHNFLRRNTHFILSTHVNPDGDGLGSQIALNDFLRGRGYKSHILNSDSTPQRYEFLDMEMEINYLTNKKLNPSLLQKCALIIIDANDIERIGKVGKMLEPLVKEIFIVDHHVSDSLLIKNNFIVEQATSTGEIVFYIINALGGKFNYKSAQALYTSILTDTGSFRFPKTDWRTHHIVSELLKEGINPSSVYQEVYENSTPGRLNILKFFLNNLTFEFNGRLAFSYITEEMLRQSGATNEELDGFVNMPLENRGVRVSVMIKWYDKQIKAALRSKGAVDVSTIAQVFNGGGHFNASGFRMDNDGTYSVETLKERLLSEFAPILKPSK